MEWVPSGWAVDGLGEGSVVCAGDADEPWGWDVRACVSPSVPRLKRNKPKSFA